MGSVEHGSLAASLAALLYLGTLRNGFAFDDHPAIERNPCVQASDHCGWSDLLHTDFWGPCSAQTGRTAPTVHLPW